MITVVHLRHSRSERILWLLEELGIEYAIEVFDRTPEFRAPAAMREIHPLGKSPLLRDGELVLAESGAIVEYLVARYGGGALAPAPEDAAWPRYLFWLHYCEGSLMAWLVMELISGTPPIHAELRRTVDWIEGDMIGRDFAAGDRFSAADVMLAYALNFAESRGHLDEAPGLKAYTARMLAREAYQRARQKAA